MFFKDAMGNRDTLTLGYDTAATKLIDAAFGEVNIIGVPLDTAFDVRVTDEWETMNGAGHGQGTFHTKKQISYMKCGTPSNLQSIDIYTKHWPVTATWNKTIFNDSCRNGSLITGITPGGWWDVGNPSDLFRAIFLEKDSVIFTSNCFSQGFYQATSYINNSQDTIPVFWQIFADSTLILNSINEQSTKKNAITLFPNPATNSISISLDKSFGESSNICFYNTYGQLVLSTSQKENIDVTNFPVGLYLVRVADKYGRTQTKKFQKI